MLRFLPAIIAAVLLVYCFLDCSATRDDEVRTLPRWAWLAVIVILPVLGPFLWLAFGRPARGQGTRPAVPPPPAAPDDDPAFLARLRQEEEDRRLLEAWEEDLRRRERELRRDDPSE
ncbi:MAG: PLD nuclease N-terminal domain-containing protein [Actinomycetia bacterium]|nr:PLD nuclease N-terminal domain-containing protein [Actinomycetes bacterium]